MEWHLEPRIHNAVAPQNKLSSGGLKCGFACWCFGLVVLDQASGFRTCSLHNACSRWIMYSTHNLWISGHWPIVLCLPHPSHVWGRSFWESTFCSSLYRLLSCRLPPLSDLLLVVKNKWGWGDGDGTVQHGAWQLRHFRTLGLAVKIFLDRGQYPSCAYHIFNDATAKHCGTIPFGLFDRHALGTPRADQPLKYFGVMCCCLDWRDGGRHLR